MDEKKVAKKLAQFDILAQATDIINFKGNTLIRGKDDLYHLMDSTTFSQAAYTAFPGLPLSQIRELEHMFRAMATDRTDKKHLIRMGKKVWNMRTLDWCDEKPANCVFSTRLAPAKDKAAAWQFITQLACGDEVLAWDILQGLAPLFMDRRPAGVIWFIGGGANGKSALVNAVYKIVGQHLASMTVKMIEDGKDTPRLNGMLGNICRESSEGRIDDTESYKAIGTHEPFTAHKFYSQDTISITGDLHHVFNANNIPVFSDKTQGARRRTLIVPFDNMFSDDPTFEARTFTPAFLSGLLQLMLDATKIIADNHYKYRFGEATTRAKEDYDADVNSAEAFYHYLVEQKVEAFNGYGNLHMAYDNWCRDEGLVPLGATQLKRAMRTLGKVERRSIRDDNGNPRKWWFFKNSTTPIAELTTLSNGFSVGLKASQKEEALREQASLGVKW